MDYQKIYNAIIDRAQKENRKKLRKVNPSYVYYEMHHIVPRCIGGTDDKHNLVLLTPDEHFVAHELLIKIHPTVGELVFAINIMAGKSKSRKLFAWHRRALSEAQRIRKTGKKSGPMSDAHKDAIGASNSGKNNGMFGKIPWNKGKKTGIKSSGSFPVGSVPWNKGVKVGKVTAGCFKAGHIPWNKKEVYDE